jgi:hypothetical protein
MLPKCQARARTLVMTSGGQCQPASITSRKVATVKNQKESTRIDKLYFKRFRDLRLFARHKDCMDIREDTASGDGDSRQQLVQLLVIPHGELNMAWNDARLLVVTGSVPCELEHFCGKVFHDGSHVDWGSGADAVGIPALFQEPVDATHRELETCLGRAGL